MVEIRFVNFERNQALEVFTQKHLGALLRRFQKREGGPHRFEVHFKLDAKAPLGKLKNSEVIIMYRYPGLEKDVVVKKQGADLRQVLQKAAHALKDTVQKMTEKKEGGRKTQGRTKKYIRQ
ncbi:MAG: HPF/RaiA family ribosome-associated protein [Bdellovibrionaceae bacterium]|nr:HPF/RaiA family ribosome-associated protein [Pseudobdellovibrionaceae bacterium]MDW8190503.1 HPF/RaiA family ribosome-associated protein [Pseudobdellovibrionaceae bacterium]